MEAERAVDALVATGRRRETAMRCVGYAALIQAGGWEGIAEQMPREAVDGLRRAFADARLDPDAIEFPHGARDFLAEVVRSSAHARSVEAARRLIG